MNFRKFPDIELFHNVVKNAESYNNPSIQYRSKIKLHGTNAAVRVKDGVVGAQSRTQLITPENDNAGFARWVKTREEWFKSIPCQDIVDIAIFGEWCGPGIMKGTAINQIPSKCFAVFAIIFYPEYAKDDEDSARVLSDPGEIEMFLGEKPNDVYVLPWHCDPISIEFSNRENLHKVAEKLNEHVREIEPCDPWVKATFGIEGIAEGAVYYPIGEHGKLRHWFSNFVFKAKGDKHKVVKTKEAVQVSPEVAATIGEFVAMFVTEARLEQGLAVVGEADAKKTGDFLKWFMSDVFKESVAELEASDLTWEQVCNSVQSSARAWFLGKARKI